MAMFQRMFGRRRSPAEDEANPTPGIEATEERPEEMNCDDFVLIGNPSDQNSAVFDPPPGYTLGGANAFLPYALDPKCAMPGSFQRTLSVDPQTAIDGIPFKLGSSVPLEGRIQNIDLSSATQVIQKINLFNWDEFEYSFQLEKSILQEFETGEEEQSSE